MPRFSGPRFEAVVIEDFRLKSGTLILVEGSLVWFRFSGLYFVVDPYDNVLYTSDSEDWVWRYLIIDKKWY